MPRNGEPSAAFVYDEFHISDSPSLLPASLEHLKMTLCEMSAADAIEKVFDNSPTSLRSLRLELKYEHDMSTLRGGNHLAKLELLAAESGIKLSVTLPDKAKRDWAVAA